MSFTAFTPRVVRTSRGHLAWFRAPRPSLSPNHKPRSLFSWMHMKNHRKWGNTSSSKTRMTWKRRAIKRIPPPSARRFSTRASSIRHTPQFCTGVSDLDQFGSYLQVSAEKTKSEVVESFDDLSWLNQYGSMRDNERMHAFVQTIKAEPYSEQAEVEL